MLFIVDIECCCGNGCPLFANIFKEDIEERTELFAATIWGKRMLSSKFDWDEFVTGVINFRKSCGGSIDIRILLKNWDSRSFMLSCETLKLSDKDFLCFDLGFMASS